MTPWQTLTRYRPHEGTLASLLATRAEPDPARPLLLFERRTWSYGELGAAVERAARGLRARGVGKGARVAVIAGNSDAYVILFLALARAGAVLVPVNPELTAGEATTLLGHAEVAAVACGAATRPAARAACAALARAPALIDLDDLDNLDNLDNLDDLDGLADGQAPPADVTGDDTALLLYTSGTTGTPKGVLHAQRTLVLAGEGFVERMHLTPDDRLLCVLPLYHINALCYSLCGALAAGASLVLAPRFSASRFWRLAAETGATEANLIAATGTILARRPRAEHVPGHRLAKIYTAGVAPEVADVLRDELGVATVIEGYGMTEIPGAASQPFLGPHRRGSFGTAARHPAPGRRLSELRVVDDEGRDVADGRVGELWVRTPLSMQGYHRDPEATAAAFRDGWFLTGDLVRRDPDGHHTFVARRKDIIRRRGENISGAELDRVLARHPQVAEAAAIAVPSELGEDEILAVVVPRPGAALAPDALRAFCARHLAPAKLPRYVVLVDALPHTPTHRVAKHKLRADPSLLARAVDLERPS